MENLGDHTSPSSAEFTSVIRGESIHEDGESGGEEELFEVNEGPISCESRMGTNPVIINTILHHLNKQPTRKPPALANNLISTSPEILLEG